jgi:phosphohistidine phosphatase
VKRLTLMRHADARWQDAGVPDLERPLSRRGTSAAESMGRRLLEVELVPDLLIASPARRTQQTAEIVARELALPPRRVLREESLYLASAHDMLRTVHGSGPRIAHLFVIAHNPGLSELVQLLVPEDERGLATAAVCSIACPRHHARGAPGPALRPLRLGSRQHSGTLTARPPCEVSL